MIEPFASLLQQAGSSVWLLVLLLIVATFVLEDAAVISGALLVSEGLLSGSVAIAALFVGIVLGDLGLYAIGFATQRYAWAARLRAKAATERFRQWLLGNVWFALFVSRFVPGLRLPVYTLSGALAIPFGRFVWVIVLSNGIWVPSLFYLVYQSGSALTQGFLGLGYWGWLLPALVLYLLNRVVKWYVNQSF